ncbi:MAG: hypothetical protein ACRC80_01895 [Waterburya sp.]
MRQSLRCAIATAQKQALQAAVQDAQTQAEEVLSTFIYYCLFGFFY